MLGRIGAAVPREALRFAEADVSPEIKGIRMEKAAQDFEALFIFQLLKTMKTAAASDDKDGDGFGKDVFMSIADQALADKMSESGALGIGQLIVNSLKGGSGTHTASASSGDCGAERFISLDRGRSVPIRVRSPRFIPVDTSERNYRGSTKTPAQIDLLIQKSCRRHGLPMRLVRAVIHIESAGDVHAVSNRGAKGLMQLTDSTAQELGVQNVFDPEENIDAGSQYLSRLLKRFSGNVKLALAAYNAGPSAVERYGGIPPFSETIRYVDKVLRLMEDDF